MVPERKYRVACWLRCRTVSRMLASLQTSLCHQSRWTEVPHKCSNFVVVRSPGTGGGGLMLNGPAASDAIKRGSSGSVFTEEYAPLGVPTQRRRSRSKWRHIIRDNYSSVDDGWIISRMYKCISIVVSSAASSLSSFLFARAHYRIMNRSKTSSLIERWGIHGR